MPAPPTPDPLKPAERRFIIGFMACVIIIPLLFGELFPFTSAPMFRDRPEVYCVYEVKGPDGAALPLEQFTLQRNYDGNPPGLGAGVTAPPTLDVFGEAPPMKAVRAHVQRALAARPDALSFVDVSQTVIGPVDADRVGVVRTETIRVGRDDP